MPGSADLPADAGEPADMVAVAGASRTFGRLTAVADVSFRVPPGTIVGLVGSDGAGKTTLLRMIAAMIPPTAGRITVGGLDVFAARGRVKELIGYMPQRFALYPDLTVAENLDFCMDVHGVTGAERRRRRERFLGFSNLLPFVDRRAADLSGGMKQKLGLACVLVHHPRGHDDPGVDGLPRRGRALRPDPDPAQRQPSGRRAAGRGSRGRGGPRAGHDRSHPRGGQGALARCLRTLTPSS